MLLLIFAGLRVLVLENEVNLSPLEPYGIESSCKAHLVRRTTLVGSKHYHVRGRV